MAADRVELVGGPLDGETVARQRGRFAWVSARLLRLRQPFNGLPKSRLEARGASNDPQPGRALYERDSDHGCYLFAGHRRVLCTHCGGYHSKAEGGAEQRPCALGGGEA